jgi:glycosyltransferase involved in cell wall biosynthesis
MEILIYNWKDIKNPLVGGAEIITHIYAKQLVADGHRVTWFCRSFPNAKQKETIDGITVIRRGGVLTTYWEGYRYYRSLTKKPELVIDMLNTFAWQTPLYAKESKVVQYVNQLAKEVWDYGLPPPFSWCGKLFEYLELVPYHHQKVITYAPSTVDDLVAWGYERSKIFQFRLGLDHSRYRPGKKASYPLLVFVARMVANKRPDLVVKAFAEVLKKQPTAKLALVGSGPFKPKVDALIKRLGIAEQVLMPEKDILFFQKVAGDQKVRLMQEGWCFVHPSVKEGWGMVITEAAACGTPSIATAVTGQVDAVKDGKTGLLISQNPTVDELAIAMLKVIEDDTLRETMSANCLDWAAEFNWEKSYQLFKEALKQAVDVTL